MMYPLHPLLAESPSDVHPHAPGEGPTERPAGGSRGAQFLDGEVQSCAVDAPAAPSPAGATSRLYFPPPRATPPPPGAPTLCEAVGTIVQGGGK